MNFDRIKTVLGSKTVGIAGCGGLGSNCAVALARAGVGRLIIADFDVIETSNLNRQYFFYDQIGLSKAETLKSNINRINPEVMVESHQVMLNEQNIQEIYKDCDVIVEAFDKAEMKEMIIKSAAMHFPDKYLVMGMGVAGWGKNNIISEKRYDKLVICGDGLLETSDDAPPIAPKVGIVSNMQANAVLEILLGEMEALS